MQTFQTTVYLRNRILLLALYTGSELLQLMAVVLDHSVKSVNLRPAFLGFLEHLPLSKLARYEICRCLETTLKLARLNKSQWHQLMNTLNKINCFD